MNVTLKHRDELIDLIAPQPGLFRVAIAVGDVVRAGSHLGELEALGTLHALVAPDVSGRVVAIADPSLARPAVDYGAVLATIDPRAVAGVASTAAAAASAVAGNVFRAPTSGRFYARPSPDKPAFVEVGATLDRGATICLLEVMKTFTRVTYQGEQALVAEVLVADGADVNAGDPLIRFQ